MPTQSNLHNQIRIAARNKNYGLILQHVTTAIKEEVTLDNLKITNIFDSYIKNAEGLYLNNNGQYYCFYNTGRHPKFSSVRTLIPLATWALLQYHLNRSSMVNAPTLLTLIQTLLKHDPRMFGTIDDGALTLCGKERKLLTHDRTHNQSAQTYACRDRTEKLDDLSYIMNHPHTVATTEPTDNEATKGIQAAADTRNYKMVLRLLQDPQNTGKLTSITVAKDVNYSGDHSATIPCRIPLALWLVERFDKQMLHECGNKATLLKCMQIVKATDPTSFETIDKQKVTDNGLVFTPDESYVGTTKNYNTTYKHSAATYVIKHGLKACFDITMGQAIFSTATPTAEQSNMLPMCAVTLGSTALLAAGITMLLTLPAVVSGIPVAAMAGALIATGLCMAAMAAWHSYSSHASQSREGKPNFFDHKPANTASAKPPAYPTVPQQAAA